MSIFSQVATGRPGSNVFNLSHEKKITCDMSTLVPVYLEEIVPGDRFRVNSEIMLRMAPTLAPIMHRVNVSTHFFFVPNRIVWDNWQDFITGGEDGQYSGLIPRIPINDATKTKFGKKSLADYFGIPAIDTSVVLTENYDINALPFRGYAEIFNEYYRDQNLQEKIAVDKGDTLDNAQAHAITNLLTRNWEKDYFTSGFPWAQKGNPVNAPIDIGYSNPAWLGDEGDNTGAQWTQDTIGNTTDGAITANGPGGGLARMVRNIDEEATGIDVNELRKAIRLQEWLEKNARAGSRYVESIMAHFAERVPDYTAQRPIYLGGGKQPVTISEVLSTYSGEAANTHDLPQGNMSGHGISVGKTNRFNAKFTEHGFVFGIMSIMPRTAYQQGFERFWNKLDKFDFYWPEFAQLGEQEVENSEVYYDPLQENVENRETFSYQARYAEYKYKQSQVAGDFRDNLAFWHMGRIFSNRPSLNEEFIQADPRKDIFAVNDPDTNNLYVQIYHNVKAIRKMPYHNVPTL